MKKLLTALLIIFSTMFITSCEDNSEVPTNRNYLRVETIGNHQYLFYNTDYAGGICHYEDCEYCKTHKE